MSQNKLRLGLTGPLQGKTPETGTTLVEMLISAAIIGTVGTYTAVAVSNSMAAKKDMEVQNFAAQFEEPLRATMAGIIMEIAEKSCLDGVATSPLVGKKLSTEYTYETFATPNPEPAKSPQNWKDAWERCQKGWTFDTSKQTAHLCQVIKPTSNHRNAVLPKNLAKGRDEYDPDYTFVEARFSLINLFTQKNFATCTPPGNGSGTLPIPATEYSGNINRGYKLYYTIYSFKKGSEGRRRYDQTSGFKQAGANHSYNYCVTRDKTNARVPGSAGVCDLRHSDLTLSDFSVSTLAIPEDAKDLFYPPPPDPCELDPNLPECAPPAPPGAEELFSKIDINQDGRLKAQEIPVELANTWTNFDKDSNNSLDEDEFEEAWASVSPAVADAAEWGGGNNNP